VAICISRLCSESSDVVPKVVFYQCVKDGNFSQLMIHFLKS